MSGGVDISAEALEAMMLHFGNLPNPDAAMATVRALRAALDAAEQQFREHVERAADDHIAARDAADAAGYARGVREAADKAGCRIRCDECVREKRRCLREAAILALLPATDATKETRDA